MKRLTPLLFLLILATLSPATELPNILWISSEDNGPQLGCYGDDYATTPNLDAFASRSLRYTRASSSAPVCAPARTTIISGVFPPSTGSEHMRSMVARPEWMKMFPAYLREKGYYTTNHTKEDYNLKKSDEVWDESGGKAHWNKRGEGQPFFAVFNFTISHESRIRNEIDPKNQIHDPAKVRVPDYHPDIPEVRQDWAQYYDRLTMMDAECGARLKEIEEAGLADDTIVFYWGDHGSGMPRSKRWPYNSGLNVPLIIHIPEKWAHLAPEDYEAGGSSDRRVSFLDLAPTVLSLIGEKPKDWMQGRAFAGQFPAPAREYSHGFRGRMDERYDLVRTVFGKRYIYLRQYMPHRAYGQYIDYMFQTNTTKLWHQMFLDGELNEAQSHFWRTKPAEELYDLETDPSEVNNLVDSPQHQAILEKMRAAHQAWEAEIRDIGFLPEAEVHGRAAAAGVTPYEMGQDPELYDFDGIFAAAQLATTLKDGDFPRVVELLDSEDSAVRYWGAIGLLNHGKRAVAEAEDELLAALEDESPSVQIFAAETLGRFGDDAHLEKVLDVLLSHANVATGNVFEAMLSTNAIDYLDEKAVSRLDEIKALPRKPNQKIERVDGYVRNILPKVISDLETE